MILVLSSDPLEILRNEDCPLYVNVTGEDGLPQLTRNWWENSSRRFLVGANAGTQCEQQLLDAGTAYLAGDRGVELRISGADGAGVLAEVLSAFSVRIDLRRGANPHPFSDSDSRFPFPLGDSGGLGDNPLIVAMSSTANTFDADVSMLLPSVSLPIALRLALSNLTLDYTGDAHADVPALVAPHRLASLSVAPLEFCPRGCGPNQLEAAVRVREWDGGEVLSAIIGAIAADGALPLRFWGVSRGTAGSLTRRPVGDALLDLSFPSRPVLDFDALFQALVSKLGNAMVDTNRTADGTTGTNTDTEADAVTIHGVHFLSAGPEVDDAAFNAANPIVLPCVVPAFFCPVSGANANADNLTASNVTIGVNVSFPNPLPFPLQVSIPAMRLRAECCVYNPLFSMELHAVTYNSTSPSFFFVVTSAPHSLSMIQSAVAEINRGATDVAIRVRGSKEGNLISTMFSRMEAVVVVPAKGTPARNDSSTLSPFAPPPGHEVLSYSLVGTSDVSLTVEALVQFTFPFKFVFDMGEVDFVGRYTDVAMSRFRTPLRLVPGANALAFRLTVFGESSLSSRCSRAPITNQRFCVANELIDRVLSRDVLPDGTAFSGSASFVNVFGVRTEIRVDFTLYQQNAQSRDVFRPPELEILPAFGFNMGSTVWGFLSGLMSSSFTASVWITFHSVVNFTITTTHVALDVYINDISGVPYYWYLPGSPFPPNHNFPMVTGIDQPLSDFVVSPFENRTTTVAAEVKWTGITEAAARLYNSYYVQRRICINLLNGFADIQISHGDDPPLIYTQQFNVYNISGISYNDCASVADCDPRAVALLRFDDFGSASRGRLQLNGQAAFSESELALTSGHSQAGSAFISSKLPLKSRWDIRFSFRIAAGGLGAADGLALVLHNDPRGATALGGGCSSQVGSGVCQGYVGVANSIAVIFNDYGTNKIFIALNGDSSPIYQSSLPTPIADGALHVARVTYHPITKVFAIYLDGAVVFVCDFDLSPIAFDAEGKGFVGLTSSTGAFYTATHSITSLSYNVVATDVAQTTVFESGQIRGRVNTQGVFTIDAQDSCGRPRTEVGPRTLSSFFIYLSIHPSIYLSVSVYLSLCTYIYLSIFLLSVLACAQRVSLMFLGWRPTVSRAALSGITGHLPRIQHGGSRRRDISGLLHRSGGWQLRRAARAVGARTRHCSNCNRIRHCRCRQREELTSKLLFISMAHVHYNY